MRTCLHSVLAVVDHGAILKADLAGQEKLSGLKQTTNSNKVLGCQDYIRGGTSF